MYDRLDNMPIYKHLDSSVDANFYNHVLVALKRLGPEIRFPIPKLKHLDLILEKEAWLSAFPDSDRFGGKTGIISDEAIFEYALKKHLTLGLDYYYSDYYGSWHAKAPAHLFQADLVLKF